MKIFKRTKNIDINLDNLTMKDIMNFPEKRNAGSEEFYVNKIFNPNHIQIGVVQSRVYSSGIHDFEYDAKKKRIKIFSRFRNSAFLIYGYLIMPLLLIILGRKISWELIGITVGMFIFLSLILIIGIKSESKEIEREMVLRINYLRPNKENQWKKL